ncbi:MAG: hypothetical protein MI739_05695, partial [Bacteroidales bacterium]|nr:hypothetical protein [Bacteroidales bacterium]
RVLMFHKFDELGNTEKLVKATCFNYTNHTHLTLLNKVTHQSFSNGSADNMPPVEFSYSQAKVGTKLHKVNPDQLSNIPAGVDGSKWQFTDLYGEGLNGLLHTENQAWYYKPNLGDKAIYTDGADSNNPDLQLGNIQLLKQKPSLADKNGGNFYLGDVDSDSQPELVFQSEGINGYYSLENGEWQNFTPFAQMPNINISDLNVKNIDLTGNGLSDILISKGSYFEMYFSEGKKGYEEYRKVYTADTEEQGPVVLFSDVKQSIFLADMVGDGLSDIVRITHNSVCYWPNMGYGHFGEKVLMKNPPIFDSPDIFNSSYIKLSDVDGTGTTDILYLGNPLRYYKNQAGNSWSKAHTIDIFPATDSMSQIHITDLLGNGTQCLVWSSPLPAHEHNMCFVELTSGIKPYLLSRFKNNMGRKVDLSYAPSTKFYLQDKIAGKNWITRLPFPVQVLEKVEDYEQVSNLRLVNKYAYHHGYYDTTEREFRGFAMVEQWDTEHLNLGNTDNEGYQPPVYTKKWFHTGFYKDRKNISSQFAKEYFKGDSDAWLLPDTVLPQNLTAQEEREACRALRGQLLRSETYASDGSKLQNTPYLVEEKNFTINRIQAKANNKHASFLVSDNEAISYHYERNIADPRILHTLALEIDAYGNVLKSAQVSYPRRITSEAKSEQLALKIVVSQNDVINKLEKNINLIGIPYQAQSFELKGLNFKWGSSNKLTVHDINQACQKAQNNTSGFVLECFQHQQTTYYNTELTAALNLGEIVAHALPYQNFMADLTDSMLAELKKKSVPVNKNLLIDEAKYIYRDAIYWIPSERQEFDKNKFFQPVKAIDPIGNITSITYDKYNLFITQTTNALNQTILAKSNYRVLQTQKITDANNNTQELSFDTLGMIKAQALKGSNAEGDTLDLPTVKYSYDLNQWIKFKKPVYVKVEMRETHADANSAWLTSYVYTGGHGNEVMTKAQAENGEVNGKACTNRWVGTGRTILNNKGNVIKQYEPYFSDTHEYESETAITQNGVSPIFYYDPIGRNIKTDFPDGTFTKVEFTPWLQKNYDQNDTVLESKWYIDKGKPGVSDPEPVDALKRAAWLAAQHANTPQVKHFDNLGREFQTDDNNGKDSDNNDIIYSVHNTLDIAGRPIKVTDAKGREMTKIQMGMQQSFAVYNIDSGNRYNLSDVMGKPLYTWDNRNHKIKYTYDQLNRPLQLTLISNNKTYVIEKTIYGSSAQQNNIGQIEKQYDQSGLTLFSYDFKGNVIQTQKQFCVQYKGYRNWDTVENEPLNKETFTHAFSFDALNRPLSKTLPDSTSETYTYNKAGLLETVTNNSKQYVTDINYNAKGQRTSIKYGNNTTTYYQYCRFTFRLTRLYTRRNANNDLMQDLNYIYDPVGNIVEQFDDAQQKHYFSNTVIEPKGTYQYDALYRLIKATGRELKNLQMPSSNDFANDIAVLNTASNAMQKYSRQYTYDQLGNIIKLVNKNTWTRNYFYNFDKNNYLLGHTENTTDYTYDTHGNMLKMPHLQALHWDFKDQLQMVELNSDGNKAYYIYDTQGNRTRKVVKKGNVLEERFYLGDYELYRKTT